MLYTHSQNAHSKFIINVKFYLITLLNYKFFFTTTYQITQSKLLISLNLLYRNMYHHVPTSRSGAHTNIQYIYLENCIMNFVEKLNDFEAEMLHGVQELNFIKR